MDPLLLTLASKKCRELSDRFDGFINVILDDWRGWHFIYDVKQSNCCTNGCEQCPLYQLLKDEEDGYFSAGLLPAAVEDKILFGTQNFLNCKSFLQYQNCYINFLLKKCSTAEEICNELNLVGDVRVIYSVQDTPARQERRFKVGVIRAILERSTSNKERIICEYLDANPDFFGT